jgi:superfamily I DNA/RNA helicase
VSHIHAADTAPEGVVSHVVQDEVAKVIQVGDAFLSRFNKPLISMVYTLIAAGVPAKVEGRDIANGLKSLATKWKVKSLDAYVERLNKWCERQVQRFEQAEKVAQAQAISDKVGCMLVIVDRVRALNPATKAPADDLCAQIDSIFGDDVSPKEVVTLSSIHKSKGREWKKVFWLQAENNRAKQEWEQEQEVNLKYVAATRAMAELVLVA